MWRQREAQTGTSSPTALPVRVETAHTRFAPLVHGVGVRPYVWPGLVLLGVVLAVTLTGVIAASRDLDVTVTTVASLAGALVGYLRPGR